jgi:hypothetical protein
MAQVGTVTALADAIRRVTVDLQELDSHFAFDLIGGLAVSVRAEPRFTRDIDLAVAVTDDRDAESLSPSFSRQVTACSRLWNRQDRTPRDRPLEGLHKSPIDGTMHAFRLNHV